MCKPSAALRGSLCAAAEGWRTTCTRCDVHLCEACELLGRHAWGAEHVRLRKMGAPPPAAAEQQANVFNPQPLPPNANEVKFFMGHFSSGRAGFEDIPPQPARGHQSSGPYCFAPVPPPRNSNSNGSLFAMGHPTSDRQGFMPSGVPPGAPAFSAGPSPPVFPPVFGCPPAGGGAPPPSS